MLEIKKPQVVNYYRAIEGRTNFLPESLTSLYNIYWQGYLGEQELSKIISGVYPKWVIHDLQVKWYNQVQYDLIIISDEKIIQFEVKNFSGDYYYDNSKLYRENGYVAKNVISQYQTAHDVLLEIVNKFKINRTVESYIVFINPTFTLFGDFRNKANYILRSELYKLEKIIGTNFNNEENEKIYRFLHSLHKPFVNYNQTFEKIPFESIKGESNALNVSI